MMNEIIYDLPEFRLQASAVQTVPFLTLCSKRIHLKIDDVFHDEDVSRKTNMKYPNVFWNCITLLLATATQPWSNDFEICLRTQAWPDVHHELNQKDSWDASNEMNHTDIWGANNAINQKNICGASYETNQKDIWGASNEINQKEIWGASNELNQNDIWGADHEVHQKDIWGASNEINQKDIWGASNEILQKDI